MICQHYSCVIFLTAIEIILVFDHLICCIRFNIKILRFNNVHSRILVQRKKFYCSLSCFSVRFPLHAFQNFCSLKCDTNVEMGHQFLRNKVLNFLKSSTASETICYMCKYWKTNFGVEKLIETSLNRSISDIMTKNVPSIFNILLCLLH